MWDFGLTQNHLLQRNPGAKWISSFGNCTCENSFFYLLLLPSPPLPWDLPHSTFSSANRLSRERKGRSDEISWGSLYEIVSTILHIAWFELWETKRMRQGYSEKRHPSYGLNNNWIPILKGKVLSKEAGQSGTWFREVRAFISNTLLGQMIHSMQFCHSSLGKLPWDRLKKVWWKKNEAFFVETSKQ